MLFDRLVWLGCIPWLVHSLASTDELSDADPAQSGYLPNHNMQPSIVGSSGFGILWSQTFNAKELWYAKPLVYTPPGQKQLVFTASNQNWIRTFDAVTGTLIQARQVQPPFLQSDVGCTDMPNTIGIAGTPVIDPGTNTVYFFAKGYQNGASSGGVAKGIYKFYAVDILDLTDQPSFPVLIDGHNADNDPTRYFIGGTVLQRPSLTMVGGTVYGAFGGHCDLFNYTGMVAGLGTTAGLGVTSMFAMESTPGAPPATTDIMVQAGGKAGIWMSGMAPATDGSRIFVVSGNGQGHENKDTPASGRAPLSTLDEVVANFAISNGKLALQDYFEPYEYIGMDAGDRDLGSGGLALLDPSVFKGTNGVTRMAITIGKNGKAYILNADNLGGFKLGSGATDNILQTIIAPNAVFGGAGSYPLEGGFIYFTPVGAPTLVYKLGLDQNGSPLFTKVGQSADTSAGRVGVGVPTITTYKGQAGTGIVWITDVDAGLKAYRAVPDASGNLVKINIPPTGGLNKFQRSGFGDGRLYVTDNNARLICMGSPVSTPLNCTGPVDFGDVTIGSLKTVTVQCTTLIPITMINGLTIQDATFQASNSSLPQGSLAQGAQFSFPVTWNLTQASIHDAAGASFGSVSPGVKTSYLTLITTNGVAQYSNSLPITLQGNEVSSNAYLALTPLEVDFGGIVVGSPGAATGLDSSFTISNTGSSPLRILGYAYTGTSGAVNYTNTTTSNGRTVMGDSFTSSGLPAVNSTISAGQSLTVPINFNSAQVGNYHSLFNVWTNGGHKVVLLTGSATTSPIANLAVETAEGGWDTSGIMNFGTVLAGTIKTRRLRICNVGGSALLITKSKPPVDAELRAENPTSDLHEGQSIPAGQCAYAPIDIAANTEPPNVAPHDVSDVWILNTDDLTFGVHDVQIKATIVSRQLGPTYANGTAKYDYLGCYSDGAGRQLQQVYDLGASNDNGICQTKCQSLGYTFAGTEYHSQCWCGGFPPQAVKYTPESARKCTFGCTNDTTQACGGDGAYISIYYDSSKYVPDCKAVPCSNVSSSSTTSQSSTSSSTTSSTSAFRISISSTTSSNSSSTSSISRSSISSSQTSSSTTSASSPTNSSSTTLSVSSSTSSISSTSTSSSQSSNSTASTSFPTSSSSTTLSASSSTSSTSSTSKSSSQTSTSTTSASSPTRSSSTTSSASSSISSTSSTSASSSQTSTSTVSTSSPTSSPTSASWKALGCYKEGPTDKSIYPYTYRYANNSMTIEICQDFCRGKGTSYAGVEYRRECYCGNTIAGDAVANDPGCTLTCMGNTSEICGGSTRMNIYQAIKVTTTASPNPSTSTSSSTSLSSLATSASSSSTSASPTSSSSTSTTSSSSSSLATSASSSSTSASPTSSSLSSTTSQSSSSSSTPKSSPSSTSTSVTATTASTPSTSSTITTITSTTHYITPTPASTATATSGFYSLGCYAEPPYPTKKPWAAQLLAADNMSPDLCISAFSSANANMKPGASEYAVFGLEYGRECWAATSMVQSQTSLIGNKACTLACKAMTSVSCGGRAMYDYYVPTSYQATLTATSVPVSTTGTVKTTSTA